MSGVVTLLVAQIGADDRLRDVSADHATGMAATILKNAEEGIGYGGLCDPIAVRPLPEIDEDGIAYLLISGAHRLAAVKLLGRDSIAAVEYDIGAIGARRLEIEENLVRHDLNALDRAFFVREYRDIFEAEYGEVQRGGDQNRKLRLWSTEAAERFGIGKDASARHLRIADKLHSDAVKMLRGTKWAENQSALLALAGVTPSDMQSVVLKRLLDPANEGWTVRDAIAGGPKKENRDEVWFGRSSEMVMKGNKTQRRRLYTELLLNDTDILREAAEASGWTLTLARKAPEGGV